MLRSSRGEKGREGSAGLSKVTDSITTSMLPPGPYTRIHSISASQKHARTSYRSPLVLWSLPCGALYDNRRIRGNLSYPSDYPAIHGHHLNEAMRVSETEERKTLAAFSRVRLALDKERVDRRSKRTSPRPAILLM